MLNWKLIRGLNEEDAKELCRLDEQVTLADSMGNRIPERMRSELVRLQVLALARIEYDTLVKQPASQDAPGSTE